MTTKITLNNIADTALATLTGPKVTTIVYPGTETATDIAGGETINLTGAGFQSGCSVLVASTASSVVTFISSTQISFIAPALSAGTYVIYVINPDGGTAISIPGISYSGTPNWTTTAGSLGSAYETGAISSTLTATGDAPITYTLASGTLPTGSSLASNGTLSGTAPATASATTYTFTVTAKDAQNQTTNRSFSLTINPDVVTWSNPADSTTYTVTKDSVISNVTMSATSAAGGSITYTADTLPTGLSITGANIAGTPTVSANTTTTLTATSTATRTATKTINWVVSVSNDTFFKYTTLLLQGASTTFVDDASTNNFAITVNGDTKPNSFNPYSPGYYSNYFDGSTVEIVAGNSNLAFGSNSFTFECWANFSSVTSGNLFDMRPASTNGAYPNLYMNAGVLSYYVNSADQITGGTLVANTWYHIALCRSGGSTRLFVNGTQVGSTYSDANSYLNGTNRPIIGGQGYLGTATFTGYISNIRILNGTALYTTTFTPPTTPLTAITNTSLLTCQSNRFIDNSSNAFAITTSGSPQIKSFIPFAPNSSYSTYGSGYFDGTGDYLSIPNNTAFNLAAENFTIEGWMYQTSAASGVPIVCKYSTGVQSFYIGVYNGGWDVAIYYGSSSYVTITSGTVALALNTWNHFALVRNGANYVFYVNGIQVATSSNVQTIATSSWAVTIGSMDGRAFYFPGYITDVRIVKGTAVYTTTFTPPSAPLTAIANTSLLTLQNNQSVNNSVFLDNSSNNFFVTRNGNTTQGAFSPYGANWSNYFNGSSYITLSSAPIAATGTFTFECWVYVTGTATSQTIYGQYATADTGRFNMFWNDVANKFTLSISTTSYDSVSTYSPNTWYHIAWVRDGSNNLSLYVNGVRDFTTTGISTSLSTTNPIIAARTTGAVPYYGYISNMRITNTVVYSGTSFTVPTTPLTNISGTTLLTCQSNSFVDNETITKTFTISGTPTIQRFSPFNPSSLTPTSYSGYFDGTGDYLVTPANAALTFGTGDLTLECWIYQTTTSVSTYRVIFGDNVYGSAGGYTLYSYNNALNLWKGGSPAVELIAPAGTITLNAWTHVAWTRSGSSNRLFINGTQVGSTTTDATNYTSTTSYIGASQAGTLPFAGYISNVRIVKGTAVYTSNFTPSTTPLTAITNTSLLTLQSTRFIDNSTNNFTITAYGDSKPTIQNPFGYTSALTTGYTVSTIGGSSYFDGTGDYLTVPSNTAFGFGTGDFTIEGWFYFTGTISTYQRPWWMGDDNDNLEINASVIRFGGASLTVITGPTAVANTWYHIAYSRQSGSGKLFVNGTQVGSTTASSYSSSARTVTLMATSGGANPSTGYISDFRIVKGTAIYTSNFVPPSQPLTAIQNTVLLNNMTGAGIYDASTMTNMETVGDAKLSTAISKFGGSSMYFDGSGDYLYSPTNINTNLSVVYTVECWFYSTSLSSDAVLWFNGTYGNDDNRIQLTVRTTGRIDVYSVNTGVQNYYPQSATGVITTNTWYHAAVVNTGSTVVLYVNGTSVANSVITGTPPTVNTLYIGYGRASTSNVFYTGYIDDLRVTKGYARYTSNFTAPTSEFKTF